MAERRRPDIAAAGTAETNGEPGLSLSVAAEIRGSLGSIAAEMRRQREDRDSLNQSIYPVTIPAQQGTVASGAVSIGSAELNGPRTGIVWDVRRVTVIGLAANDVITLYRVSTGSSTLGEQNVNEITQITNQTSNEKDGLYAPGLGACLVRAGQSLLVAAASGLTATTITVTWDAISVPETWLGAYLL